LYKKTIQTVNLEKQIIENQKTLFFNFKAILLFFFIHYLDYVKIKFSTVKKIEEFSIYKCQKSILI